MSETAKSTRTLRFDEMAVLVNDRIDNPAEADVDRYVGLEHLDPESLKIRRWGETTDVESTKLLFRSGDIIFGKRRVYQRKLAVADFNGICSAHAMVLRARSEAVLPEFLPFFMQSDIFMNRALEISVGSLSPTINWKTLARQEFALPPLEEQRRIAEVLLSVELLAERLQCAEVQARQVMQSQLTTQFQSGLNFPQNWVRLESLCEAIADGTHQPPPFSDSDVPFLLVSDIRDGRINWNADKHVSQATFNDLTKYLRPQTNDVLYTLVGSYGFPAVVDVDSPFTFQRHVGLIRTDPKRLRPRYLFWYLCSPSGLMQAHWRATGLAQKTITLGELRNFMVPAPAIQTQDELISEFDAMRGAIDDLSRRIQLVKRLARAISAHALGGEKK